MRNNSATVAAIIPALNEASTVTFVVEQLAKRATVIVVDDGSTDGTAQKARQAGAIVIVHPFNKGYDAALASGIHYAQELGFVYAVTLDADGQHEPDRIDHFVASLENGSDIVIGVRDRQQRFAEYVFASVSRRLWRIDDPLCGMKGYRLDRFRNAGPFDQYKSIGTRYAIIAGRSRFIIRQIPVSVRPRIDAPRFASGWLGNFVILKAMLLGLFLARSVRA